MTQNTYPVVYLLDGTAHFVHATGVVHFLSQNDQIPQMIMVAIPNTDRGRDLTPTRVEVEGRTTTSGGADNFLKFIEDELKPKIDSTFRTSPYNILIGHSLAGAFTVYSMVTKPELFDSYISISPGLTWDNEFIIKRAENFFRSNKDFKADLFITFADEIGEMKESMDKLVKLLETSAPQNLRWEFSSRPNQNHGTVVHNSIYDGLEYIYSDWPIPAEIIAKNDLIALKGHYDRRSASLGYVIIIPENTLNNFGYRLLQNSQFDEAISAFKMNVKNYPNSANVYDSLGDGYDAAGRTEEAYKSYKNAYENGLKIDDPNTGIYKLNMERTAKVLGIEVDDSDDKTAENDI
jgi:predicted alpha/beta superfamily hydrolase